MPRITLLSVWAASIVLAACTTTIPSSIPSRPGLTRVPMRVSHPARVQVPMGVGHPVQP